MPGSADEEKEEKEEEEEEEEEEEGNVVGSQRVSSWLLINMKTNKA
jgi:hypothetical protein